MRQSNNRLDQLEDIAVFYVYDPRNLEVTGPHGKRLMVLTPVFDSVTEKIVEGPIPVGFDGPVRLPRYTNRAIFSPMGSVSVLRTHYRQPYLAHVRNEGNKAARLRITCLGHCPA